MRTISLPLSIIALTFGTITVGCSSSSTPEVSAGGQAALGGTNATEGSGGAIGNGGQSNPSSNSGNGGAGGNTATSSAQNAGGVVSNGGTNSTLGTSATGGTKSTIANTIAGGSISTGGTIATGGAATTGGGSTATGGTSTSVGTTTPGGSTATGGTKTVSAGGTTTAGGATAAGGTKQNGGASGIGGTTAAGGATVAGGASNAGSSNNGGGSTGCTPPAKYDNLFVSLSGHTQADSDAKVAAAWSKLFNPSGSGNIYFNGPGTDESYVKDIADGDVRTEGMSYGMMVAVQLDHQTEFDRLWKWVRNHMAQNCTTSGCTGEIAWSCSPSGSKNSTGGAPDGEEYMATALIFAHTRWGDTTGVYNYATEAQWVLDLIRTKYFNSTYHLVKFISGANNTDGSYVLPAFYQTWACFDAANTDFWNSAVTAGRTFFHNAIDGNGVIGDQSSFTGSTTKGAGPDTIRCVVNIMMDHNFFNADPWQTATYAKVYGGYEKSQQVWTAQMSCNALLGFGLPAADGKPFVDKLWSAAIPSGNYWDGVLYMLGMLHVSGTFKLWY